jgi:hypothetical protein
MGGGQVPAWRLLTEVAPRVGRRARRRWKHALVFNPEEAADEF